jgi:hypothetical protein
MCAKTIGVLENITIEETFNIWNINQLENTVNYTIKAAASQKFISFTDTQICWAACMCSQSSYC